MLKPHLTSICPRLTLADDKMKSWFHKNFCLGALVAVVFLAGQLLAANTNAIPGVTQDEMVNNFLQIQEQLHATQLALEQAQLSAADQTRSNADLLAARLQAVEQLVGE